MAEEKLWTIESGKVVELFETDLQNGLSAGEAETRLRKYGPNTLREVRKKGALEIFFEQFKSLIVLLLAAAALLSFGFEEIVEGIAILAVILINALIGYFIEIRAVRSMEALRQLSSVDAVVRRDGKAELISADRLVPGDVVVLEGGDVVTADMRLCEASRLQVDESALTGESVPVNKITETVSADAPLAERVNMLYKGTAITRGSAVAIVTASGMETELGKISSLVSEAEKGETPLEKRLDDLGKKLVYVTIGLTVIIAILGILRGKEAFLMIKTAVALAVAGIPEGLPIVATIALARGMLRMARRNALINRLASVETLGATNIICTDKTGTLTENRMTVTELWLPEGEVKLESGRFNLDGSPLDPQKDKQLFEALKISVLCNNAAFDRDAPDKSVGDPLEVALLAAGAKAGLIRDELRDKFPEKREEAFDSVEKRMATFHEDGDGFYVAVKGAPEAILAISDKIIKDGSSVAFDLKEKDRWIKFNNDMARQGLRVLALANKTTADVAEDPYDNLIFTGMIALMDPPREDVRESIELCQEAGIRVIMVTGDQAPTAQTIAYQVGLTDQQDARVMPTRELVSYDTMTAEQKQDVSTVPIFARVSPAQKLDIIALHQEQDQIVAMTGDGVNDAPALKKADIGIAMGQRGTQVAREAADMVLKDDAFATIVTAIEQGRVIFNNIRRFVVYLMSCNVSEILAVAVASLANTPLPLLPLQILFLNLVTDVFPALALGVGEGDPEIMKRPSRKSSEAIVEKAHWAFIGGFGVLIALTVLVAFGIAMWTLDKEYPQAVTISFLSLAFAQLFHVFNMRDSGTHPFYNSITRNRWVWGALVLCTGLLFMAVYLPGLSSVLKLTDPGMDGWLVVAVASIFPYIAGQVFRSVTKPVDRPGQK